MYNKQSVRCSLKIYIQIYGHFVIQSADCYSDEEVAKTTSLARPQYYI